MKSKAAKMGSSRKARDEESAAIKRDPYTFVAYVTGPIYKFDVSAKDFDEAYKKAIDILNVKMGKYEGKVKIDRIEMSKFEGIF